MPLLRLVLSLTGCTARHQSDMSDSTAGFRSILSCFFPDLPCRTSRTAPGVRRTGVLVLQRRLDRPSGAKRTRRSGAMRLYWWAARRPVVLAS